MDLKCWNYKQRQVGIYGIVDKNYIRPLDVNTLLGNASKARKKLNWEPEITFDDLVSEMMSEDIYLAKQHDTFKTAGERIFKI